MLIRWKAWSAWATRVTGLIVVAVGIGNWVSVMVSRFATSTATISAFTAQKTLDQFYTQLAHWVLFILLGLAICVIGWRIEAKRSEVEASPSEVRKYTE